VNSLAWNYQRIRTKFEANLEATHHEAQLELTHELKFIVSFPAHAVGLAGLLRGCRLQTYKRARCISTHILAVMHRYGVGTRQCAD